MNHWFNGETIDIPIENLEPNNAFGTFQCFGSEAEMLQACVNTFDFPTSGFHYEFFPPFLLLVSLLGVGVHLLNTHNKVSDSWARRILWLVVFTVFLSSLGVTGLLVMQI